MNTFNRSFFMWMLMKEFWLRSCRTIYFDRVQTIEQQRAYEYVEPQELLSYKSVRSFLYTHTARYVYAFVHARKRNKTFGKNNYLSGSRCSAQWGKMSRSYKYHAAGKSRRVSGAAHATLDKRERSMARTGRRPLEEK